MRITSAHVHSNGASAEPAKGGSAAGSFFAALSGAAHGASTNPLPASAIGDYLSGDEAAPGKDGQGGSEAESGGGFSLAQGGEDASAQAASGDAPQAASTASTIPAILSFPFPIVSLAQQGLLVRTAGADAKAEAGDADGPSSKRAKDDAADTAAADHPVEVAMNNLALPAGAERLPVMPLHAYAADGDRPAMQAARNGVLPLPDLSSVTNAAEHAAKAAKDAAEDDRGKAPASGNGSAEGSLESTNPGAASSVDANSGSGQSSPAGQGFTVPSDSTASPAVSNAANGAPSVDNANSKGDSNPLLSANSTSGSTPTASDSDSGKSSPSDAVSSAAVTPAQMAVASGQIAQHAQPDVAQVAASSGKAADGGAPDVQLMPMRAAGHDANLPQRAAGGAADLPRPGELRSDSAAESGESATVSGVNVAKLMQAMSGTEMHVGMSSAEFGDISIRASVSQQQMLAQISLNHNDLGQAILAHVSTVQAKLGNEYGMQASIAVHHQGAATAGDSGQSQQRDQRGFSRSSKGGSEAQPAEIESGGLPPVSTSMALDVSRLDIQA